MSKVQDQKPAKVNIHTLKTLKEKNSKFTMITCYDAVFAKLIEETSIEIILVGDSLGNVMLGYNNTIPVTMDDMLHHTKAVTRKSLRPLICADMPFLSYNISEEQALTNAGRLIAEGGAECIKVEGGEAILPQVKKIVQAGIPVMGHLGLTPQSLHAIGGFRVQGKTNEHAKKLQQDALKLEEAGIFALVLEMVPAALAEEITKTLKIPTIGIGAGIHCDGQVLVLHDLLGLDQGFKPKFLKKYLDGASLVKGALNQFDSEVKDCQFPTKDHSF